jgi:ATP-dependent DNA helicase DinG
MQIFTDILPQYGFTFREKQLELAEHILHVISHRGITLAESEVGTGKTIAYLTAAILAKRSRINDFHLRCHYPKQGWAESAHMPIVISTSSIALQNALMKDYIPELSRILIRHDIINTPLTAVIRKGKEHYICEKRLLRYYCNSDKQTQALLDPCIGVDAPFDLTGADSLSPVMKRNICVSRDCAQSHKCRYAIHMKRINDPTIDFQITNHNYFLADTLHRASGRKPLLPHYQLVVIDEAHKFLAAARSMYGVELVCDELPALAQSIHSFTIGKSNGGVNVHRIAKQMEEQNGKLFQKLRSNIPATDDEAERYPAVMDGEVSRYMKKLLGITADLSEAVADSRVHKLYRDRQSKALRKLALIRERIEAIRQHSNIHWLEKEPPALCSIPKDLNERLYRDLWSGGIPVVLTSGTLSASGDFSRIRETLGLNPLPETKLFSISLLSPFDFRRNCLLYLSQNTPFPDAEDKGYIAAVAEEIERLVLASHGHAAVLFTSYKVMGQVHAILKRRKLTFPLFRLERGGVHAIEQFKKSSNGILLASGSLWEGIDIPGDTLSMLIIVKLPFAPPDPIGEYERSVCGSMEGYKERCLVPDMLVKLRQGFGRLLRVETDTGCVAILDCRASSVYRDVVLEALPPCGVTSEKCDVRGFYRRVISPCYFSEER